MLCSNSSAQCSGGVVFFAISPNPQVPLVACLGAPRVVLVLVCVAGAGYTRPVGEAALRVGYAVARKSEAMIPQAAAASRRLGQALLMLGVG